MRDLLANSLTRLNPRHRGPRPSSHKWLWALKDISFEVPEGDVTGIIGRNGAGKSTLLKILTRITLPTEGSAQIWGRVGSLLEVGTGFHPELTGRENVYFNGAILGMTKAEIDSKFDEIVAFAETEKFIDTVVKHYSSGMQVRLAFSVAAHLEPEIMLVDEVLAVGDLSFQKKCFQKMSEIARGGRTVLFVSHQLNQVRRLCNNVMWLERGEILQYGPAAAVVSAYETAVMKPSTESPDGTRDGATRFVGWHVGDSTDQHSVDSMNPVTVNFHLDVHDTVDSGHIGIALYNGERQLMWADAIPDVDLRSGRYRVSFRLPSLPLQPGAYQWLVSLWGIDEAVDIWEAIPDLQIATPPLGHVSDQWTGFLNIPAEFSIDPETD